MSQFAGTGPLNEGLKKVEAIYRYINVPYRPRSLYPLFSTFRPLYTPLKVRLYEVLQNGPRIRKITILVL